MHENWARTPLPRAGYEVQLLGALTFSTQILQNAKINVSSACPIFHPQQSLYVLWPLLLAGWPSVPLPRIFSKASPLFSYQIVKLPTYESRIASLADGSVDMVIGALFVTPERAKAVTLLQPYYYSATVQLFAPGGAIPGVSRSPWEPKCKAPLPISAGGLAAWHHAEMF